MKLITVRYLGFTAMDRRFSDAMLPWIVSEIKKRESRDQVSLGAEDGTLQGYNTDFELQFSHRIQDISRFSQADTDPCAFLYLVVDQNDKLLYCYMFQANQSSDVSDLYQQIRDQSASTTAPSLTSLCGDISPSSSHFFEVLYVGKIRVSHRKVPETFIDDALLKFRSHELARRASYDSQISNDSSSTNCDQTSAEETVEKPVLSSQFSHQSDKESDESSAKSILGHHGDGSVHRRDHDHNRTMVLQVGRMDLRLISPDRKQVLLHRHHKDVVVCVQGVRSPEHFGFVCREPHQASNQFVGYIFKCESASVVSDAVGAVSQAATAPSMNPSSMNRPRSGSVTGASFWSPTTGSTVTTCEHCPMVWYHRLCTDIEGLGDRKTQAMIYRRVENLDEEEQQSILTKFRGAETDSTRDQNEFLMMLLRAHCEMKQNRHVHDTAENRSEFLSHYLGNNQAERAPGTIFMKAKRSLSSSFEHLLKRKGSRDDIGALIPRDLSLPVAPPQLFVREDSPTTPTPEEPSGVRKSRSGVELSPEKSEKMSASPKSPMMDIFMKVGNSPRTPHPETDSMEATPRNTGSWRQAIFNRVVTPNKTNLTGNQKRNNHRIIDEESEIKRTSEELRLLWKRAIKQAILLVRMEKENARLRLRQEASAMKRVKLEYDEMTTHTSSSLPLWDMVTSGGTPDRRLLLTGAVRGVLAPRRGEVWQRLAKMYSNDKPPFDSSQFPNYEMPYEQLLKQLTAHQHAILIDLGRTFPNHPFYKSPLGPGQLALFNLLKAYSLLDPEVGYCQGLSFVAGVLLLHMEEADAFKLLKHLMFRRGLRSLYLPDMIALQIKLYQLSRLLRDRQSELYNHLDNHEVATTLYAAPWLLTLFASQFPLGFVARVFDILFVEGTDIIFRIAMSLLSYHSEALLTCDSFEQIMDYLKSRLPDLDPNTLDKLMATALNPSADVTQRLNEYKVEYQVLQEEAISTRPFIEEIGKLRNENRALIERNSALSSQLEITLSNVQRLERNRTLQQSAVNKLEVQARALEVSVITLGTFIDSLVEKRIDMQIPGDVRRIVSQLMVNERRKHDQRPESSRQLIRTISNSTNLFKNETEEQPPKSETKKMVKSLSTGRISLSQSSNDPTPRSISLQSASDLERELRLSRSLSLLPENQRNSPLRVLDEEKQSSKVSHFFSNTHSNILRHQRGASPPNSPPHVIREESREDMSPLEEQRPFEEPNNNRKNIDLPLTETTLDDLVSPSDSTDSGVGVTPQSPQLKTNLGGFSSTSFSSTSSSTSTTHPLSGCDVNFTYNGTTKLKNIKSIKNLSRNSSPDLLGK